MNKIKFEEPKAELLTFAVEDVITLSVADSGDGDNGDFGNLFG